VTSRACDVTPFAAYPGRVYLVSMALETN